MQIVSFANDSPDRYWRLEIPKKWIESQTSHKFNIYDLKNWIQHINKADIIIGRSFISPTAVKYIHAYGKKIIYELDGVDEYYPKNAQDLHDIKIKQRSINLQKETILKCDGVLVATKPIEDWVSSFYSGPTRLFPSYIDFNWWNSVKPRIRKKPDKKLRIACFGMPTHNVDIKSLLLPVLQKIVRSYSDVSFYFPESVTSIIPSKLKKCSIFIKPWKINERPLLARKLGINIMLVPLSDNKFNKCKTAIKYYENAADKIPGVYSPTVYKQYVKHKKTGLIASNVGRWIKSIDDLVRDRKLYKNIAQNSYKDVKNNFNAATKYKEWLETINFLKK